MKTGGMARCWKYRRRRYRPVRKKEKFKCGFEELFAGGQDEFGAGLAEGEISG